MTEEPSTAAARFRGTVPGVKPRRRQDTHSATKKATIAVTASTRPTNSGVCVGNVPEEAGTVCLRTIEPAIARRGDRFRVFRLGFSLYERAWILRGIEPVLMDFMENPSFVEELFDRIIDFNLAIVGRMCRFPVDAFHFGDDWGQQKGLIIRPALWRKFFKPRLRRLYDEVHLAGLPVSTHSCGDITEILPDLIEIGVNMITPLQAEALDFDFLKREYGRDLTFWGGVSTQRTLPYGTPADVRREIRDRIRVLGKGGGYILAPSHELQGDVPLANMLAFLDEARH